MRRSPPDPIRLSNLNDAGHGSLSQIFRRKGSGRIDEYPRPLISTVP
ncbi:MAG: hypothetical protein WKF75_07775 [Singulisphaera sp.]